MSEGNQERNIMILFLSNFIFSRYSKDKLDENGDRIFKADGEPEQEPRQCLLPPGRYRMEALSAAGNEEPWVECIQTNEAPIKDVLLTLNGAPLDAVFCLVSDKVGGRTEGSGNITVWKEKNSDACETFTNEMQLFFAERLPSINEDPKIKAVSKTPLTADIFREVEFHESADDPSAESIRVATELEDAITDYIKDENQKGNALSIKNIHIYADITGGKRTANMAMSAALQLLQYDGANLERVVYSDYDRDRQAKENEKKPIHPVSNVQPINDLYQLVAGVDAFKKYGSSAALNDYFATEKDLFPQLKKMLEAMDKFSAAVLLCAPDVFENELRNLTDSIKEFSEQEKALEEKSPKIKLLARMIPDFKRIYEGMIVQTEGGLKSADRIAVIKWCVENSLIQQALTFITEWMPEFFVDHKIAYTDDPEIMELCEMRGSGGMMRDWKKNFILEYRGEQPNQQKLCDSVRKEIQEMLNAVKEGKSKQEALSMLTMEKRLFGTLPSFMKQYEDALLRLQEGRGGNNATEKVRICIEKIWRSRMAAMDYNKTLEMCIEKATPKDIVNFLANAGINDYIGLFDLPLPRQVQNSRKKKKKGMEESKQNTNQKYPYIEPTKLGNGTKAENRQLVYRALLDCGMMKTAFLREQAEELLLKYSEIHDLRNQSNHAAQSVERASFSKVHEKLEEYLALLDKMLASKEATS